MNTDNLNFSRQRGFSPANLPGLDTLAELALDLQWSWNHAADALLQQLDAELWDRTHNPWVVLQTTSREALEHHLADDFTARVLPAYEGVAVPLEDQHIYWQR